MSPATGLFTCLRSYPSNAGEADGARRILTALLGRVGEAVHQVAKRLAGLKVSTVHGLLACYRFAMPAVCFQKKMGYRVCSSGYAATDTS
jgi:hypothetical protein